MKICLNCRSTPITALQLKTRRGSLPPWPGVRHLTPDLSATFQAAATPEAKKKGIARVHLDAIWWSVSRDLKFERDRRGEKGRDRDLFDVRK